MKKAMIALAVLAAGAAAWLLRPRPETAEAPPETFRVVRREFASAVSALGAVKPQVGAEVRVGSRLSGRVERLHANLKDVVRKGQTIAELEARDLDAAVEQRRAELELAEAKRAAVRALAPREIERAAAEAEQRRATLDLARRELRRQDDLLREEFISQQARDQSDERLRVAAAQDEAARASLELSRARAAEDLRQASAEVERAKAALVAAEVQRSYAVIAAPISGVIASVSTQEGETVAAGLNAPTFVTIVDLARLQVDAYVDEVDIGKVQVGQKAVLQVDAFPALEFEGKAVAIYPKAILQDNVVKYVVAVDLAPGYEGKLRPEMTASVTIRLESRVALAVPSRAVRREGGRTVAYVLAGGRAEAQEVRVGWRHGPWTEIAAGLEEGQEVLVEPPEVKGGGNE